METLRFSLGLKGRKHKSYLMYNFFYTFVILTILFEIGCSFIIYYISSHSHNVQIHSQLEIEANRIENTLQDIFAETYQVMMYVGKQISLYSEQDPKIIEKILIHSSEFVSNIKNLYPWSLFDWVNPDNLRVMNSQMGFIKGGSQKVLDSYTIDCPRKPWTLQFSQPTIGNTSGMWVIPVGLGVTNKDNKYLGTLNIGFNIAELNAKVQQTLTSAIISFVVLDDQHRIILQSSDNSIDPKSSYYRDMLSDKGFQSFPFSYKDITYTFYKKLQNYPFVIIIGFNKKLSQKEFWSILLPRLLELYGVGLFCLFLLYILRKKIFTLNNASRIAKKKYLQRINSEMKQSIETILSYSNVLIKNFWEKNGIVVPDERKIEFMEKIYQAAISLHTLVGNTSNFEYFSINLLIENSIPILTEISLEKNISIKANFDPSLLPFYGDSLRLQQIIISLISLSLEYSPKNSTIRISTSHKISDEGKMLLIIAIEDDGFSLDADDIIRISEKFSHEEKEEPTEQYLDFSTIKQLLQLYKGSCYICNKSQGGKIINVTLPYSSEEDKPKENLSDETNVYWLFGKDEASSN